MIITLNDSDIKLALENYVKSVIGRPISKCEINITAGRGANGYSADVEVFFVDSATPNVGTPLSELGYSVPTEEPKQKEIAAPVETTSAVEPKLFDTPEEILEPAESKPTLASKVSNPEDGKKTNLNLFSSED